MSIDSNKIHFVDSTESFGEAERSKILSVLSRLVLDVNVDLEVRKETPEGELAADYTISPRTGRASYKLLNFGKTDNYCEKIGQAVFKMRDRGPTNEEAHDEFRHSLESTFNFYVQPLEDQNSPQK